VYIESVLEFGKVTLFADWMQAFSHGYFGEKSSTLLQILSIFALQLLVVGVTCYCLILQSALSSSEPDMVCQRLMYSVFPFMLC